MTSLKLKTIAIAAAVICCLATSGTLFACTGPNVIYTAEGSFSPTVINGNDLFKLAGEPFQITVTGNECDSAAGNPHGPQWAEYTKLSVTGQVTSGLIPTPITFSNKSTSILLNAGNPKYDVVEIFTPVEVVGITIYVEAIVNAPLGTFSKANDHVLPFSGPVTMTPSIATMTYSDPTTGSSTELGMNGTLTAVAQ